MLSTEALDHYRDATRRLETVKDEEALNLACWLGERAKYMVAEIDRMTAERTQEKDGRLKSMFESTGTHYCPKCDPVFSNRGNRIDEPLYLTTRNYSGTGTDIAHCRSCDGYFIITYKVDTITEKK